MDKFVRNDDVNDVDNGAGDEPYPGLSIFTAEGRPQQPTNVIGSQAKSNKLRQKQKLLSPQEKRVVKYVVEKGYSLRHTAKLIGIDESVVREYWNNVKEKMK